MEGWVGLSTTSVNNLLKISTRQLSWWDSNPRPLSHYPTHTSTPPSHVLYFVAGLSQRRVFGWLAVWLEYHLIALYTTPLCNTWAGAWNRQWTDVNSLSRNLPTSRRRHPLDESTTNCALCRTSNMKTYAMFSTGDRFKFLALKVGQYWCSYDKNSVACF